MEQRIESLKRLYEAKVLEADENIKLLLIFFDYLLNFFLVDS